MAKTKLTLSVDKEVIKQAKSKIVLQSKTMSEVVENVLKSYTISWIDKIMDKLGIKEKYVSYEFIIKKRKPGFNAGKIIRSMRNARQNSISR